MSHGPSKSFINAGLVLKKHLLLLLMLKTVVLLNILVENKMLFSGFFVFFCSIINVFTVTFDQFNGSLLKKNINL